MPSERALVAKSEHNKERRATTVIYKKKKTSDVYLKSFIKNGDDLLSHNVAIE